jgi:uncharacterized membrane protein YhhN
MNAASAGLLALAMALALVDWWAVARRLERLEVVAKPAVIVALIGVVVLLEPSAPSLARFLVLVALAASLVGDVALLPGRSFLLGVAAFAVAQVAYAASFAVRSVASVGLVAGVATAVAVALVVGRPLLRAAPRELRVALTGYLLAILTMAVLATATLVPAAIIGAWAFVASDALLAWSRFVAPAAATTVPRRLATMVTYHVAQMLLVLSLVV